MQHFLRGFEALISFAPFALLAYLSYFIHKRGLIAFLRTAIISP
jgi:hypothetical protein